MARTRAQMTEETRDRLIQAARQAFARDGFAATSMDALTAAVGLTRGALYHNFGDKTGLLAAVVDRMDAEMADRARQIGSDAADPWEALMAEGCAYIRMALDPEVQRIVLLDGPAFLGDPSRWPSQNRCLEATRAAVAALEAAGRLRPVDLEAAARLLNGAALNAALWVGAAEDPAATLPRAQHAFRLLAEGLLRRD